MKRKLVFYWNVTKETFSAYLDHKAPRLGAALAYYTIFSLAPLLILVVAIAGAVFGQDAVRGQLVGELRGLIGDEGGALIESVLANARMPSSNLVASIVGLLTLLFGASGVFGELQDAVNTIWEVKPKPGRGIKGIIRDRFLSFAMILGTGFLLLVTLVISAGLSALGHLLAHGDQATVFFWHVINMFVSFAVVAGLFALIFKGLPDVKLAWRDVWLGAIVTALLFTFGKLAIGLYLGQSTSASVYGASAALAIVLLWAYFSAQILLMGVEFTRAYKYAREGHVEPAENAVSVTAESPPQGFSANDHLGQQPG